MTEVQSAVLVFVLLLASTGLGAIVRPLLPEERKGQETVQLIQLLVGMRDLRGARAWPSDGIGENHFDTTSTDVRNYATSLIELDHAMHDYGHDLDYAHTAAQLHGGRDRQHLARRAASVGQLSARHGDAAQ